MEKVRYMISDAAGLVNVEAHVLRYWEEELELDIPRNELGHRYYTKENIEQFLKIKEWKEKGYQLKAIKMLVHEKSTEPEVETETRELLSAAEPLHTEVVDVQGGTCSRGQTERGGVKPYGAVPDVNDEHCKKRDRGKQPCARKRSGRPGRRPGVKGNELPHARTGRTGGRTLPEAR